MSWKRFPFRQSFSGDDVQAVIEGRPGPLIDGRAYATPEFLAEAKSLGFEVDPVLGEKMQKIVEKVLATPKDVAVKAKGLME